MDITGRHSLGKHDGYQWHREHKGVAVVSKLLLKSTGDVTLSFPYC
jgi:hypothetical protein